MTFNGPVYSYVERVEGGNGPVVAHSHDISFRPGDNKPSLRAVETPSISDPNLLGVGKTTSNGKQVEREATSVPLPVHKALEAEVHTLSPELQALFKYLLSKESGPEAQEISQACNTDSGQR